VVSKRLSRRVVAGLVAAFVLVGVAALPASAAGPDIERHTSFSYTLSDSLADFAADPNSYEVDCGTFKAIATFDVTRSIFAWPDREVRHVVYAGSYVNASEPTKSVPRNGDFVRTTIFDANGEPIRSVARGVQIWTVLDGRRVNLVAGRDVNENDIFVHHGLDRDQTIVCGALS
jgi:hypothetical protein